MNYKMSYKNLGIKNFNQKYLSTLNLKINTLKKEVEKKEKFALTAIKISKERANAIRKKIPKKQYTGYFLLELKLNFYENKPLYKYKLETPIFSGFNINNAKNIIIKDLETIFKLKFTFSKLNNVIDRDNYFFYLTISKNINKEFYNIEFVTTKYFEEEIFLERSITKKEVQYAGNP